MNALANAPVDPQTEWLLHARPVGLVLGANIIREEELVPPRQGAVETEAVRTLLSSDADEDTPVLADPWAFCSGILGWEARFVAGVPGGSDIPDSLAVKVPEHDVTLAPDWAVRELGQAGGYQLLVKLHLTVDAERRGALDGWEASAHQQFERLLRDSGAAIGVLIDRTHLRIVYAPSGETSGWIPFPLRSLGTVAGRAMLGGLKLMLGHARLFTEPEPRRLPKLLARSREAQNQVSAKLAEQVLGALHELLRAFHAADGARIERLAASAPQHLYEGLLTTLLRLVFLLYAEDRDLIPSARSGEAVEIYEAGYSVRGLYARLAEDRALHPDTMDERVGGWGRLLALFRLVHAGHPSGWIARRGGKLFDPQAFPFLEGREEGEPPDAAKVLPIRDGALLRILEGLMTIEARTLTGERVRERLSYRALDVEQIGSVYETVMGFTVEVARGRSLAIRAGKHNRTPVFVNLEKLAAAKGKERIKFLKEEAERAALSASVAKAVEAATNVAEMAAALDAVVDERGSSSSQESPAGTPILQPTDERRRTGSHYTPRSLTEPIVRHALEPAFERLGLRATPEQILDLKVCDMAMGSGAFLVEACRQLATRLVAAWAVHKDKKPAIPSDETEELHARRLVAQRCLYGVDKNPLATDLAKLSLWLATLAREHEFTFLDHALKSGDSLVGLTREQIEAANWDLSKDSAPLLRGILRERVNEVAVGRREIQMAPDDVTRAVQESRHRIVEQRLEGPRLYGDAIVAAFFSAEKPRKREEQRVEVAKLISGLGPERERTQRLQAIAATLKQGEHPLTPFHWEIEFPEIFSRGNPGFDAIVGNPPFAGKNTIIAGNRLNYLPWLQTFHTGAHGNADLVAHFFRRALRLLRGGGIFGLIATKTVGQGDTRDTGLATIIAEGGAIAQATRRLKWPGEAAVTVSVIHMVKGAVLSAILDGRQVRRISAYLVEGDLDHAPARLLANEGRAFNGTKIYGQGFLFDDFEANSSGTSSTLAEMKQLVAKDERNALAIKPYIGGDEITSDPTQSHYRYVIDFGSLDEERARARWPDLMKIVERLVKPGRLKDNRPGYRRYWWRYGERRVNLYKSIDVLPRILANSSKATPHHALVFLKNGKIFSQNLNIFAFASNAAFCALQSRSHEIWARFVGTSFEDRLTYVTDDCFKTFPFPDAFESLRNLEAPGQAYHARRAALMVARNEGMTKIYNRFHDRNETSDDIARLRELHAAMDRAVLDAYGWHDLAARAEPVFLDEDNEDDHTYQGRLFWPSDFRDEVLARLLALNAERHAEEVRLGIAPGMKGRKARDEDGDEVGSED